MGTHNKMYTHKNSLARAALLFALVVPLSLLACGDDNATENPNSESQSELPEACAEVVAFSIECGFMGEEGRNDATKTCTEGHGTLNVECVGVDSCADFSACHLTESDSEPDDEPEREPDPRENRDVEGLYVVDRSWGAENRGTETCGSLVPLQVDDFDHVPAFRLTDRGEDLHTVFCDSDDCTGVHYSYFTFTEEYHGWEADGGTGSTRSDDGSTIFYYEVATLEFTSPNQARMDVREFLVEGGIEECISHLALEATRTAPDE